MKKVVCARAGTAAIAINPTNERTSIMRFDRLMRLNTLPPLLIELDGFLHCHDMFTHQEPQTDHLYALRSEKIEILLFGGLF